MSALLMAKEDIFGLWALGAAELTGTGGFFSRTLCLSHQAFAQVSRGTPTQAVTSLFPFCILLFRLAISLLKAPEKCSRVRKKQPLLTKASHPRIPGVVGES